MVLGKTNAVFLSCWLWLACCRYFRQGTLLHHYGEVLAIMMRLRQMCCHPFLVAKAADKIAETIG